MFRPVDLVVRNLGRMSMRIPERMPERMPGHLSGVLSARLSELLPERLLERMTVHRCAERRASCHFDRHRDEACVKLPELEVQPLDCEARALAAFV